MGVLATFLAAQEIPALMSKGAPDSLGGRADFAQDKFHPRKIGAVVNLRTDQSRHCVLDASSTLAGENGMHDAPPRSGYSRAANPPGRGYQQFLGGEVMVYRASDFPRLQGCYNGELY